MTRYRLACQCFIRDEDILVSFEGDQALPAKRPHMTPAAKIFKGSSLEIASLDDFLGYAVKAEEDAAIHYEELSASMEKCGNQPVATLFAQLARFSRLHLAEAQGRAASIDVSKHLPADYAWPDHATPESAISGPPIRRFHDWMRCGSRCEVRNGPLISITWSPARRRTPRSARWRRSSSTRRPTRADSRSLDHAGGMGAEEPVVMG